MNNKYSVIKLTEPKDKQEGNALQISNKHDICVLEPRQQDVHLRAAQNVEAKHKILQCVLSTGTEFNTLYQTKFTGSRVACGISF